MQCRIIWCCIVSCVADAALYLTTHDDQVLLNLNTDNNWMSGPEYYLAFSSVLKISMLRSISFNILNVFPASALKFRVSSPIESV